MKASGKITVNYGKDADDADGTDGIIRIGLWGEEHPDNKNIDDGEFRSSFSYGDTAALAVSADFSKPYGVESLIGTLQYVGAYDMDASEHVTFLYEKEKELSKFPSAIVSMEWELLKSPEEPPLLSANGKKISIPEKAFGTVNVSYVYKIHVWYLTVSKAQAEQKDSVSVPVLAMQSGGAADSVNVEYADDLGGDAQAYDFLVINDCTEDPVPGASFIFQGKDLVTGDDGRVYAGVLNHGTYQLGIIKATGYLDSDKDTLDNEKFTI